MKMADPIPTFTHLVSQLKARQPKLAYLHVVEPRVIGMDDRSEEDIGAHEGNDFIRNLWAPKALISAGGYNRQSAIDTAERKGDLIAFGRQFLANVCTFPISYSKMTLNFPISSPIWCIGWRRMFLSTRTTEKSFTLLETHQSDIPTTHLPKSLLPNLCHSCFFKFLDTSSYESIQSAVHSIALTQILLLNGEFSHLHSQRLHQV